MSPIFNLFGFLSLVSPPFLAFFVWFKFLKAKSLPERPHWKTVVDWTAILSVSGLFAVCVIAVLTIPCDVDRMGWACVARWRSFSTVVIRLTPLFLVLAAAGRRGTRIMSVLWVLAINFDCIMVDVLP
jgi:hypothetical protein